MLTSRTQVKKYFFNLFISCHSISAKLSARFTVLICKQATPTHPPNSPEKKQKYSHRNYSILMTTEMVRAQRHFETSEILLNLQENPSEWLNWALQSWLMKTRWCRGETWHIRLSTAEQIYTHLYVCSLWSHAAASQLSRFSTFKVWVCDKAVTVSLPWLMVEHRSAMLKGIPAWTLFFFNRFGLTSEQLDLFSMYPC